MSENLYVNTIPNKLDSFRPVKPLQDLLKLDLTLKSFYRKHAIPAVGINMQEKHL